VPDSDTARVAVILAGGLGTRLRTVFAGPKSLAPIAGRPLLEYLIEWLRAENIREVILCVGYKRSAVARHFGAGKKFGVRIRYSPEITPMGTAGAVKKAGQLVDDKVFFALNGDTIVDVDLAKMLAFHRRRNALATIALTRVADSARFGRVLVDAGGRVRAFREKQKVSEGQPGWINAGVYLLSHDVLRRVPANRAVSLERDVFPKLVGKRLYGFREARNLIDIGVPEDFQRAQRELPRRLTAKMKTQDRSQRTKPRKQARHAAPTR
jgi:mannose-1-phosphate guanylyltransferase